MISTFYFNLLGMEVSPQILAEKICKYTNYFWIIIFF